MAAPGAKLTGQQPDLGAMTNSPSPRGSPVAGRYLVPAWILSRLTVLAIVGSGVLSYDALLASDLVLFWKAANESSISLSEYPGAAQLLLGTATAFSSPNTLSLAWVLAMLMLDLIVLLMLRNQGERSAIVWVIAGAALGPVLWLRYDLIVAACVLAAVTNRHSRPLLSALLLSMAVLLKLWPIILAAALLPGSKWKPWLTGFSSATLAGVLLTVAALGWEGLIAPLRYQAERGIQLESLAATPVLLASTNSDPEAVWEFAYRAYHLRTDFLWVEVSGFLVTAVACLTILILTYRRQDDFATRVVGSAFLAVIAVAANMVFSPQYVIWFLPLVALAVHVARLSRLVDVLITAIALLTQLIWPWLYREVVYLEPSGLALLSMRNAGVAALALLLLWTLARPVAVPRG